MSKRLKILDLTHRLPGPLAGKILGDFGYEVIKIEDEKHKDPFLSGMFSDFDDSFEDWYRVLNEKKQILRLDFKSADIKAQIHQHLKDADGILLSLSPKLKEALGLDDASLKALNRAIAVVELEASKTHKKAMHDLNALALSGFLSLHVAHVDDQIVDPPFFPLAGIAFGQQVATQLLANLLAARDENKVVKSISYLYETTETILNPFWSANLQAQKRTKFLHNGAYPCYSLYRLKDGNYVALAAVEEKFWNDLVSLFNISLPLENRFDKDPKSFQIVSDRFAKMDTSEIENMTRDKELCLSIVRKI
ncbi:MAG: CoA transferase [Bdellovibrionales bacterium]|nr:CoA transferase [Bdellovibrionales bacterium]